MQNVFAILIVDSTGTSNISSECYSTYDGAKNFIVNRSDNPQMETPYVFKSQSRIYSIFELDCK